MCPLDYKGKLGCGEGEESMSNWHNNELAKFPCFSTNLDLLSDKYFPYLRRVFSEVEWKKECEV